MDRLGSPRKRMALANRSLLVALVVAGCSIVTAGCSTIVHCDGTAPYSLAELPEFPIEPLEPIDPAITREAASNVMATKPTPVEDWSGVGAGLLYRIRGEPGDDSHWIAWDGIEGHRALYVVKRLYGDAVAIAGAGGNRTDVYDAETGEKLASWGQWFVSYMFFADEQAWIEPVEMNGGPAMRKIMAREVQPSELRFGAGKASSLWLGICGWGRTNHRRYAQVLWIPIPVGDESN